MLPSAEAIRVSRNENFDRLAEADIILVQTAAQDYMQMLQSEEIRHRGRILQWPTFYFSAFHPDLLIDERFSSPLGVYHSAIAIKAFLMGLSVTDTVSLYRGEVFERLGYFEHLIPSLAAIRADMDACEFESREILKSWIASGIFAYTSNHPTMFVIRTIASALLKKLELRADVHYPELFLEDPLASAKWPIHGDIGEKLEVPPAEYFVIEGKQCTLAEFIEKSFACYSEAILTEAQAPLRLIDNRDAYDTLNSLTKNSRTHLYANLPSSAYWRKTVEQRSSFDLDPVVKPKFIFSGDHKIATAGSCFAQNIARVLLENGQSFLTVEQPPPELSEEQAIERGYKIFSARYGNIYTARHLLQLIRRCNGSFAPSDVAWQRPDGRFVDPYRPQLEPEGYLNADEVLKAAKEHLKAVHQVFATADIFIFTIGLTETWANKTDGAVFPIAPGVVAGQFDPERYEFHNMTVDEVIKDLTAAIEEMRKINSSIRVLLTVSPVPLVATYSGEHVVRATTYSKSVLRAAVEEVCAAFYNVDYFPSYEIICGPGSGGHYFDTDRRSVTAEGVDHVMRILRKHYLNAREFFYRRNASEIQPASSPRGFIWLRNKKLEARESSLFDPEWYLRTNPDVAAKGWNPIKHYRKHGMREGRWPNPVFDPIYYLVQCANDKRARQNPLLHYLTDGYHNSLKPNQLFDPITFLRISPSPSSVQLSALERYLELNSEAGLIYSDGQKLERWENSEDSRLAPAISREINSSTKLLCDENALDIKP